MSIEELTEASAFGPRFSGSQYSASGNVNTIRTSDFDRAGGVNFAGVPVASLPKDVVEAHQLREGDFLLSRSGEYAGLTAVFSNIPDNKAYIPAAFLIRYRFKKSLDPRYLHALCGSDFGKKYVQPLATGSAQPNISGTKFGSLYVPVPPIAEQQTIVRAIEDLNRLGMCIMKQETQSRSLMSGLINRLF